MMLSACKVVYQQAGQGECEVRICLYLCMNACRRVCVCVCVGVGVSVGGLVCTWGVWLVCACAQRHFSTDISKYSINKIF